MFRLAYTLLFFPVYSVGMHYMDLNARKMAIWIVTAVAHSVIVFWIPYGLYSPVDGSQNSKGWVDGMDVAGLMTFCSLVWGMQVKVALEIHTWTWINHLFLIVSVFHFSHCYFVIANIFPLLLLSQLSMLGFYLFIGVYQYSQSISPTFYMVAQATFYRGTYWLMLLLVVGSISAVELASQVRTAPTHHFLRKCLCSK